MARQQPVGDGGDEIALLRCGIETLAGKRPIFHSEVDFQHALAWELQVPHPDASIRLEKRVALNPNIVIDLLIETGGARLGIELKYLRRAMGAEVDGEHFTLVDGADDHGRYFAIADVARLERLLERGVIDRGALVLLTNVANVWEPARSRRRALYEDFRVHDRSHPQRCDGLGRLGRRRGAARRAPAERSRFRGPTRFSGVTTRPSPTSAFDIC